MNVNDIDFTRIGSQELDELIDAATAERYDRVAHYAGDTCAVFDEGDLVFIEGSSTPIEDLARGDVYGLDSGESYHVDDIRSHESAGQVQYHVTRTRIDDWC